MKNLLYVGEGKGLQALRLAYRDVFQKEISSSELAFMEAKPQGEITLIGRNAEHAQIYWVSVADSKKVCKQAWADLWPLLGDCISNWELIEVEES